MDDLASLDATALAELVRRKEIKPIELVDRAIDQIERLNPVYNVVVTPMFDLAREVAAGQSPDGPFGGVPFLLKDLIAEYSGVRLTDGSAFVGDRYVSQQDSELVIRLKRAGLIILGKTNTPEFGLLPTTEPRLFGPSRNPWDTGRGTGGSSGGSAGAVASGMVPMAHGSDGGGSIRIPAACCGVFGLKPTRARNPLGPRYGDRNSGLSAEHALTRSVRDSAALLDATAGPDLGDPYWAPPPDRPFAEEVGANPGRLRIAFSKEPLSGTEVHPDCIAAVEDAARLCAEVGHDVVGAAPPIDGQALGQAFFSRWAAGCVAGVEGWASRTGQEIKRDSFEPATWALYELGRRVSAPAYLLAVHEHQLMSRDMARFLADYQLWLTPTLGEPPVSIGTFDASPEDPIASFRRSGRFSPFTGLANVTGLPAMSVPLYWNADGLPIGVQFFGRFGDEATLFRLAAQLEQARPWADRWPPDPN